MQTEARTMSIQDVADETRCDVSAVFAAISKGELPWKFRLGHPVTTRSAVREWCARGRTE